MEIGQQIVSQVCQQDEALLSQEAMLAPGSQVQSVFVVAKLLDLSPSSTVVTGEKVTFRRKAEGGDIVAVMELVLLEASFHEDTDGSTKVDGRFHFTEPDIVVRIPASHLFSQRLRSSVVKAFGNDMVATSQEPAELFIAASTAVEPPNGPFSSLWC